MKTTQFRARIEGLSYDDETKSIIMLIDGEEVVCATVFQRGRSIFRHDVIRRTNRCELKGKIALVSYDDGFEIRRERRILVYLKVN